MFDKVQKDLVALEFRKFEYLGEKRKEKIIDTIDTLVLAQVDRLEKILSYNEIEEEELERISIKLTPLKKMERIEELSEKYIKIFDEMYETGDETYRTYTKVFLKTDSDEEFVEVEIDMYFRM